MFGPAQAVTPEARRGAAYQDSSPLPSSREVCISKYTRRSLHSGERAAAEGLSIANTIPLYVLVIGQLCGRWQVLAHRNHGTGRYGRMSQQGMTATENARNTSSERLCMQTCPTERKLHGGSRMCCVPAKYPREPTSSPSASPHPQLCNRQIMKSHINPPPSLVFV